MAARGGQTTTPEFNVTERDPYPSPPPFTTQNYFPTSRLKAFNLKNIQNNHTKTGPHYLNIPECEQDQHFEGKNKRNEQVGEKNSFCFVLFFKLDCY